MKNKDRIKQLESEVAELRSQVAGMRQAFELLEQSRPPQPNPFWQVNPTPLPNPLLPPYMVQNLLPIDESHEQYASGILAESRNMAGAKKVI